MTEKKLPGFTAEESLDVRNRHYIMAQNHPLQRGIISPQGFLPFPGRGGTVVCIWDDYYQIGRCHRFPSHIGYQE